MRDSDWLQGTYCLSDDKFRSILKLHSFILVFHEQAKIKKGWPPYGFTAIWGKGGRRRAAQTTALICVSITKRVGGVFVRSSWCVCWRCKLLTSVTYWMDKRIVWGWQEKTRPSGERINAAVTQCRLCATTRKVKKSDYYPQWSGMSYHCLNAVVYVRNRVLRIGNGPERSAKHSRQLGASRNIRETQPILCSWITIVTMSWQILLYRIKIVTMSCVVWTVSGRCPVERAWSGVRIRRRTILL